MEIETIVPTHVVLLALDILICFNKISFFPYIFIPHYFYMGVFFMVIFVICWMDYGISRWEYNEIRKRMDIPVILV